MNTQFFHKRQGFREMKMAIKGVVSIMAAIFAITNANQVGFQPNSHRNLISTNASRLKRNGYGGYHDGGYGGDGGYDASYGGYTKKYNCCHCDSGSSSPLLFFGLGSLLGLLFAMPMLLTPNTTRSLNGGRLSSRNDSYGFNLISKNKRDIFASMLNRKYETSTMKDAIRKVGENPECIKFWFCELYQHSVKVLPKKAKQMAEVMKLSVHTSGDFKSCNDIASSSCHKIIPT